MSEPKSITPQQRLQGLALYTLACQHYTKARDFERGLAEAIGSKEEFDDYFQDAIYGHDGRDYEAFDNVLARAGYVVAADQPEPK